LKQNNINPAKSLRPQTSKVMSANWLLNNIMGQFN
jgi:hypothetical protein